MTKPEENNWVTDDADLIGSLCAAPQSVAEAVGSNLRTTDCDTIGGQQVLAVILARLSAGQPSNLVAVQLDLIRAGEVDGPAKKTLLDAATAGRTGLEGELRALAEAAVSRSLRRVFATWGNGMASAAQEMALHDLMPAAIRQGTAARHHADRLTALGGAAL